MTPADRHDLEELIKTGTYYFSPEGQKLMRMVLDHVDLLEKQVKSLTVQVGDANFQRDLYRSEVAKILGSVIQGTTWPILEQQLRALVENPR